MYVMNRLPSHGSGGFTIARPSEPMSSKFGTFSLKDGILFKDFTMFDGLMHKDRIDIEFSSEMGTLVGVVELEHPFEEVSLEEAVASREVAWAFETGLDDDIDIPDNDVPPVVDEPVDDLPVEDDLKEDTPPVSRFPRHKSALHRTYGRKKHIPPDDLRKTPPERP